MTQRTLPAGAAQPGRRVALVHDWLTGMRGGEKVLEAIAELYPDATLHTLLHVRGTVSRPLESHEERRSFVQWLPSAARHYRRYLPLFPTAVEQFDFDPYDLVISTSHCAAKSVVVPGRAHHVCYCHSPMRYAWDQFDAYFGPAQVGATASRLLRPVLARLARWDRDTADRVDRYVANSHYVAGRIRRYYNRRSTVVYPPVNTDFFRPDPARAPEPFFLAVSALVPYKRLEIAIRACAEAGAALTIVGRGPEEPRLRRLAQTAGARVEFAGWLEDDEIRALYQRCRAVLMPGVEDFGMVPVEAQACGRPVVVFAEGGAVESVIDGVTGIHVGEQSVAAFAAALHRVQTKPFDRAGIRRHAEAFGKARFQEQFRRVLEGGPTQPAHTPDAGSNAARYRQGRGDRAARESEHKGRHKDPGEIGAEPAHTPDAGSNAARYRQGRGDPAARESEHKGLHQDSGEIGAEPAHNPDAGSNAARYRQGRGDPAAREKKQ